MSCDVHLYLNSVYTSQALLSGLQRQNSVYVRSLSVADIVEKCTYSCCNYMIILHLQV
jgi:hypothetical protein